MDSTRVPGPAPPHPPHHTTTTYYSEKHHHHRHHSSVHSTASPRADHDSVLSPFSPKPSQAPSLSLSLSPSPPPRAHLAASTDPEKAQYASANGSGSVHRRNAVYDQAEYADKDPEDRAWTLLFFLSAPCFLLALMTTLWTILAILATLLFAPLGLCTTRPTPTAQLIRLLAPPLNWHLHLVYSSATSTSYSAPMLVLIHLFGPVVALGVAVASWTAAGFWFFSSILGDPAGSDGHNDGKESILGVRNYWERWLCRGLR